MAFYTICGNPECKDFTHANYVAQFLCENLPNFRYKKIEKSKAEWPDFVTDLNKKNNWYVMKSPIIWKEINTWGGKPYLIGGLGDFWDYCYCYYGLESTISKKNLEILARDNVMFFKEETTKNLKENREYNIVLSVFISEQFDFMAYFIEDLLKIPYFATGKGLFIKLYATNNQYLKVESSTGSLENIVEYFNSLAIFGERPIAEIANSEEEAIVKSDLLIFLEDFSRNKDEDKDIWLNRSQMRVKELAEEINIYAKRGLRIIFSNEGPICFMATCMIEYCTTLMPTNIVALTFDKAYSVLSSVSQMSKTPISSMGAPAVWGFIGINEYIDEVNIIFKAQVFKPYKRALTASKGSTIPLGTTVSELRLMSYLLPDSHEEVTNLTLQRKKNIEAKLHRKPFLSKLRALNTLLELWYAQLPTDEIISLAVCSNGIYGIPPGLVFSQPCIQDNKRRWNPFPNFPIISKSISVKIQELVDDSMRICTKYVNFQSLLDCEAISG